MQRKVIARFRSFIQMFLLTIQTRIWAWLLRSPLSYLLICYVAVCALVIVSLTLSVAAVLYFLLPML